MKRDRSECRETLETARCETLYQQYLGNTFGDLNTSIIDASTWNEGQPILYVNGINTPKQVARDTVDRIATLYRTNVRGVWNPTTNFVGDATQLFIVNKPSIWDDTTIHVVREIRLMLERAPRVTVMGHSQGAAIVAAALRVLSPTERARVDVVTFGGAASSYSSGTHSLRVVVNVEDLVPQLFGYLAAERRGRRVPGIEKVYFGHFAVWSPSETHGIDKYLDLEEERLRGSYSPSPSWAIDLFTRVQLQKRKY